MIPYASRTGTARNLDELRRYGWHLLVSATGVHRTEGFPYAIDNGAWTAHQKGEPFDVGAFEAVVAKLGAGAEWIALPDIVAGGRASLDLSRSWLPKLRPLDVRLLLPVQDGMTPDDVAALVVGGCGLFLGGSTEWKIRTMPRWGNFAQRYECYFHVARVNTARRIAQAAGCHADSFDGTSATRFSVTTRALSQASRQRSIGLDTAGMFLDQRCPECGSVDLRMDTSGELDCVNCGATVQCEH